MSALLHAAVIFGIWVAVNFPLAVGWNLVSRRAPRLPVDYGPLPVPLAAPAAVDPWVALLAVDAALWSYADAIGASHGS